MTTIVIGDVHGCSVELEELLSIASADRVILVGDLFTKGPDAAGVWELIQSYDCEAVLGNHDAHVVKEWRKHRKLLAPKKAVKWLMALPLIIEEPNWMVVHGGIHPSGGETTRRMALTLRRWPSDADVSNPFWWQLYRGEKLVVYGHDAVRGVQDHRPFSLGLDSGCVYGGKLSGWLMEEERMIQVAAKRVYKPIQSKATSTMKKAGNPKATGSSVRD